MVMILIKPDRNEDFYVIWSTVTDGPCERGPRADLEWPLRLSGGEMEVPERFDRADRYGSSAVPEWGYAHWGDGGMIVRWDHTGEHEVDARWLPRANLGRWLRTGDETLTQPLDD